MRRSVALALLASVLAALTFVAAAYADPNNNNSNKLRKAVTLEGVRAHQAAFQAIADANGGNRFSGLPGYDESVDYVVEKLEAAGYDALVQPFDYLASVQVGPSTLAQAAPGSVTYVEGVDYLLMDQTEPGDVTAAVTAVDIQLGLGNTSTSGCEAADFAGFPAGNIALLQRGTCTFQAKAENAAAAGAVGAIIFNQGNTEARKPLFGGTLSAGYAGGIAVVSTSYDRGVEWAGIAGLVMHLVADVIREELPTANVFAELPGKKTDNVVMVGAHLDSVFEGPGINDNGSGSAAILEIAEQMAKVKPWNTVRFAWWGAEESGLVGSAEYVFGLPDAELDKIALYLNFDMVGSPNFVRFVYDGDGSAFGLAGPPGSAEIEQVFAGYFAANGLPTEPTAFDGRSDYQAFILSGIPAGGLFTGAEGIKTAAQAATYGGTAGQQYDPCYHQACDTFANNSNTALDQMSDAIAHTTITFAQNTSLVNGVAGKGNFNSLDKINGQATK
jgi:Zn-dependent M28 family amino/carboxypeptidase